MSMLPQPPEGILDPKIPWSRINPNSRLWLVLKSKLTGRRQGDEFYSSYVNLSDADADKLIANMKKDPRGYPSLDQESGTPIQWMERQRLYQEWLVEAYLNQAGQVSGTESFTDTTEEVQKQEEKEDEKVEEEVKENLEEASEVVEEVVKEPVVPENILDDIPDSLKDRLVEIINNKLGTKLEVEKKPSSSNISNSKLLKVLVSNLQKIQGQLASIDASLQLQNNLLRESVSKVDDSLYQIKQNDDLFGSKLDDLLDVLKAQEDFAKEELDKQEDKLAESRLEDQRDVAGTEGFKDLSGGKSLFDRITGFLLGRLAKLAKKVFGKAFKRLWKKLIPKSIRSRLRLARLALRRLAPKAIGRRMMLGASRLGVRAASKIVARHGLNFADQGERLAARAFKPVTELTQIAGEKKAAEKITTGGGMNIFQRALKSKAVQNALVKKLGKEGAEKLTVKLAAKLVPGVATAYGLGEGIARIAMGDVKGGFLSFGSAIPVAGWGFAAVDVLRDIDTAAYTKHIESNLPMPSEENFSGFFRDALGVTENEYEVGTERAKPGMATLHGQELLLSKDFDIQKQLMSPVAGAMISASSNFINQAGPAASIVAPAFKQVANKLSQEFNVPTSLAQTNIGGGFAGVQTPLKNVKKKAEQEGRGGDEIEMSPEEQKIFEEANNQTGGFLDRLLGFFGLTPIAPEQVNPPGPGNGGIVGGDGTFIQGNSGASYGIHFHIGPGSQPGVVDRAYDADARASAVQVVNHFLGQGQTVYDGRGKQWFSKGDNIEQKVKIAQDAHSATGSGGGIDLQVGGAYYPGAKLPFPLATSNMAYRPGGFGVSAMINGSNSFVAHGLNDEKGQQAPQEGKAMYKDGGSTLPYEHLAKLGEEGEEIVMPNFIAQSVARDHLLDLVPAESMQEIVQSYRKYAPEILAYDTESSDAVGAGIVIINTAQDSPAPQSPQSMVAPPTTAKKIKSTEVLLLQKLYSA